MKTGRPPRPSGELPAALRVLCQREHDHARFLMKTAPLRSIPPDMPHDWRLYVSTWVRPVIDACIRSRVWEEPK